MRVVVEAEGRLNLADELEEEFAEVAGEAVAEGARMLLAESKRLIAMHGRGAPAPPGSTPATVTGNLLKMTKQRNPRGRVRGAWASSGVKFAPHSWLVEYGHTAVDGTRVLPRPFVRPAVEATEGPIHAAMLARLSR
jgi:hypothetical protein